MTEPLAAAFDDAIARVERAMAGGMHSRHGRLATRELAALRAALAAERERALARGAVDPGWVRDTVRDVATWTPDTELALLAALGRIARAGAGHATANDPTNAPTDAPTNDPREDSRT